MTIAIRNNTPRGESSSRAERLQRDGYLTCSAFAHEALLVAILVIAVGGLSFSGYLTYRELFGAPGAAACTPVGEPGTALGAPPCVYGFVMYLAIVVLAAVALRARRRRTPNGVAGARGAGALPAR